VCLDTGDPLILDTGEIGEIFPREAW
jgi:hypothetical protein